MGATLVETTASSSGARNAVATTTMSMGSHKTAIFRVLSWAHSRLGRNTNMTISTGYKFGGEDRFIGFQLPDLMEPKETGSLFSSEEPTKVLILYQNTGGGHKASAQALKDAFELKPGHNFEVTIMDTLPLCIPPFNKSDKAYDFMVKHSFLWRYAFAWSSTAWGEKVGFAWYKVGFVDNLKKLFRSATPDLVVSVHPLLQVPVLAALKAIRQGYHEPRKVPFATVVTDYTTCHATWFDKGVDKCFVPTEETKAFGMKRGLSSGQLVLHGLPIRPAFCKQTQTKLRLRQKLKMDRSLDTVLVVGGGDGMGPVEETCSAMDRKMTGRVQIVVICGRNRKLVNRLKSRKWKSKVIVLGFVTNIHEWMSASDCIITKAGPGTIAESLVCGLPIMLNSFIPCQEAGNIPWVIENEVGDYSNDPEIVAAKVRTWFDNKGQLSIMSKKALSLGRPKATFQIVDDLVDLVKHFRWEPFKAGRLNKEMDRFATVPF